jgi:hypothetical protein
MVELKDLDNKYKMDWKGRKFLFLRRNKKRKFLRKNGFNDYL